MNPTSEKAATVDQPKAMLTMRDVLAQKQFAIQLHQSGQRIPREVRAERISLPRENPHGSRNVVFADQQIQIGIRPQQRIGIKRLRQHGAFQRHNKYSLGFERIQQSEQLVCKNQAASRGISGSNPWSLR